MKRAIFLFPFVLFTACSRIEIDPIGEPYKIELRLRQVSNTSQTVDLDALVAYGGFGNVKATVTFFDGQNVIGVVSEAMPYEDYTPKLGEVFDDDFRQTVNVQPNTSYNFTARIDWSLSGVNKSLTSNSLQYPLP